LSYAVFDKTALHEVEHAFVHLKLHHPKTEMTTQGCLHLAIDRVHEEIAWILRSLLKCGIGQMLTDYYGIFLTLLRLSTDVLKISTLAKSIPLYISIATESCKNIICHNLMSIGGIPWGWIVHGNTD
jgi:hypothetical protein